MGIHYALVSKTQNTFIQFLRYNVVSGVSFIVDFGSLILLKQFAHMNYLLATTVAFLEGMIVSYCLSVSWVFHSSKLSSQKIVLLSFIGTGLVGLALTDSIMWVLTGELGLLYTLSRLIAATFAEAWGFSVRKRYLFH